MHERVLNMGKFKYIFLILALIFLPSCLEMNELIQLQNNGSALFTLRISIPEFPEKGKKGPGSGKEDFEKEIGEMFAKTSYKGLELVSKKEEKVFGINNFILQIKANKLGDLQKFYSGMKADKKGKKSDEGKEAFDELFVKSPYKIKKTKQGTIRISRSFFPPKIKKKKEKSGDKKKDQFGKGLEEAFSNMFRIRFEFMSPTRVISSNAQRSFGKDLRWETTLGYLMKNPYDIQIEIDASPELEANLK